jgi:hypothetical protein
MGSIPKVRTDPFSKKALYYAILHRYLQQPGIIKMFLLYNILGKVPLFFLNKQDVMQVNCMQNVTKNYILLKNVAYVLERNQVYEITLHSQYGKAKINRFVLCVYSCFMLGLNSDKLSNTCNCTRGLQAFRFSL